MGLTLAALLLGAAFHYSGPGLKAESLFYDQRFLLRSSLGFGPPRSDKVVLVTITEDTYADLEEPAALWLPHLGRLLAGLFQGGALAVGLDFIPTYAPPELFGEFGRMALAHRDRLVLATNFERGKTERLVLPAGPILAVAGRGSLGMINLTRDRDTICRRQALVPIQVNTDAIEIFSTGVLRKSGLQPAHQPEWLDINYTGPPGGFPAYPMHELLRRLQKGESLTEFEGKLVLVGTTAQADLDLVETPFSQTGYATPGVEIHAQILNTLLTGSLLTPVSSGLVWLGLGLVTLLAGWSALRLPTLSGVLSGLACVALWWALGLMLFCSRGWLLAVAPIFVTVPTVLIGGYAYRYVFVEQKRLEIEKDREKIREVFGRYVCPEVMEEMLRFPDDHSPHTSVRRRVTVMFSDINSFSTACEQLEPEEVTRRLNAYFTEMSEVIFRNRGTIIRFIGDEFMVLFGAPRPDPQQELSAVRCAVEMVEHLAALQEKDPWEKDGFYSVKIGIHVGDMILTSIGSEYRSDYNCIGDAANSAARVLSLTRDAAKVLISEDVHEIVQSSSEFSFVDQGVHPVKGRRKEIRVYSIERSSPS